MTTPDISVLSMVLTIVLLVIPFAVSWKLRLGLIRDGLIATARMLLQLALVGFFLEHLFDLNQPLLTLLWLLVMVTVAALSVTRTGGLRRAIFLMPVVASLICAVALILGYFTTVILRLPNPLEAKYAIAIGGMLLGNSLKGNIIGVRDFYTALRNEQERYEYYLALGASQFEALRPYLQRAFRAALSPTVATMATLGIVFLPGMMTGQILGGVTPLVAIKYQIAIMITILTCTTVSLGLTLLFTVHTSFDRYGILRTELFDRTA